jgi:hypothetical protein
MSRIMPQKKANRSTILELPLASSPDVSVSEITADVLSAITKYKGVHFYLTPNFDDVAIFDLNLTIISPPAYKNARSDVTMNFSLSVEPTLDEDNHSGAEKISRASVYSLLTHAKIFETIKNKFNPVDVNWYKIVSPLSVDMVDSISAENLALFQVDDYSHFKSMHWPGLLWIETQDQSNGSKPTHIECEGENKAEALLTQLGAR